MLLSPRLPGPHLARGDLLAQGDRAEAAAKYEVALRGALGWGAHTLAMEAAVRLVRLDEAAAGGGGDVEARREQVREILAGFTEGLDHPLLQEARSIASA